MSLINDALKTAQSEKERHEEEGARPPIGAVLVPLRANPQAASSLRRNVTLAVSGLVVAAAALIVFLPKSRRAPLPAVPAVTSTILSEAIADSVSRRDPIVRATLPPGREAWRTPRPVDMTPSAPPSAPRASASAIPQRQSAADTSAANAEPARETRPAGQLRIAVSQPRQPESARLFAEAVAAHREGDLVLARSLYERVLLLAPNDADALNNLGVLLSAERDFGRALDLLRRAASISPSNAGVWNNIGTVLRQQSKSSDAIAAYQHALTLDPRHQGAMLGLAQQFLAISSPAQARVLLEDVLSMNPALAEAQYTLGQVLELQNDRAGAIRAYLAFIKLAPPHLASYVEFVRRRVDALSRAP